VEIPGTGLHAIAINGFSLRDTQQIASEGSNVNNLLPRLIGSRIDEFYGHDDQRGPFCRLKLLEPTATRSTVVFSGTGWNVDLVPKAIVVPVYPKIRTGFREVVKWLPTLSAVASWFWDAKGFEWDVYLTSSNQFKSELREGAVVIPQTAKEALLLEGLPKYLWRCTLKMHGASVFEMLLDTTSMVNGFPIKRLWWADDQKRSTIMNVIGNNALEKPLKVFLGDRLFALLCQP
jgi:hypothetical protein